VPLVNALVLVDIRNSQRRMWRQETTVITLCQIYFNILNRLGCDCEIPWRTRAISERLRGVIMTRRYTNPRLPLPLPLGVDHQYYGQTDRQNDL